MREFCPTLRAVLATSVASSVKCPARFSLDIEHHGRMGNIGACEFQCLGAAAGGARKTQIQHANLPHLKSRVGSALPRQVVPILGGSLAKARKSVNPSSDRGSPRRGGALIRPDDSPYPMIAPNSSGASARGRGDRRRHRVQGFPQTAEADPARERMVGTAVDGRSAHRQVAPGAARQRAPPADHL